MAGTSLAENLDDIRAKIAAAAIRAGRNANDIELIAVSKTKSFALVQEAFAAGQRSFGENYVQEAVEKAAALPEANWHFIGSLQTNKVKFLGAHFALVHTVDRFKLGQELSQSMLKIGRVQDVLLQLKIGDEESKHGIAPKEAPRLLEQLRGLEGIRVCGLMALPPLIDDVAQARSQFAEVRKTLERLESAPEFKILSMGTSSDFEAAILEGATMVRVGTSIFGARE